MEQAASLRRGEDRDRIRLPMGDEVGPFQRIHRDVDLGDRPPVRLVAPADLLADVQHRCLVAFSLADDDRARHLELVHGPAHRLGGCQIRLVLGAAAHVASGSDCRGFGDPHHLERQHLLHRISSVADHGAARATRGRNMDSILVNDGSASAP